MVLSVLSVIFGKYNIFLQTLQSHVACHDVSLYDLGKYSVLQNLQEVYLRKL